MSTEEPSRRSKRLLSKLVPFEKRTRSGRLILKSSLLPVSNSFEDNDAIIIEPKTHFIVDLSNETSSANETNSLDGFYQVAEPIMVVTKPQAEELSSTPYKSKSTRAHNEERLTPPKQRKFDNENIQTPIVLLERLSIKGSEKKRNPRQLFEEIDVYQRARKALHSTHPTTLPCREKELDTLQNFILTHLKERTSGTLYISGPPGTGKTASLNVILQNPEILSKVEDVYVNCTCLKTSVAIFSRIIRDLGIKFNPKGEKEDHIEIIETYLKKSHKTILLILDEIDQLESKKQSILYTIFEWPALRDVNLILIGIANALDLTDRILPRLQSRCELKPKLVHFPSYTKQQIVEIFTGRLSNAEVLDVFSPAALEMLAGKVAAISGDVRRALDIGRRVVELADGGKGDDSVLKSVENLGRELDYKNNAKAVTGVSLTQVISILNDVYGTTHNLDDGSGDCLPLQQKIIICSILLILKKGKNKNVFIGRLHEVYRRVCHKRNIQIVDEAEFVGLCSLIETNGIIKIVKKKDPRMNRINLMWDEEDVAMALKDKQLMYNISQDVECLGKL